MKKTIKRILASLMVAVMVLTAAPLSVFVGLELPDWFGFKAYATTYSGTCGKNLTWTLYDDGNLVINGSGDMTDFIAPWSSVNQSIYKVTINEGVTTIGSYAFYTTCDSLASITIPNTVTTIGNGAFYDCDSLTSVTIPDSVTTIGDSAFSSCDSLTDIDVVKNNTVYSSIDGVLFNKDKTTLIQYPAGKTATSYTIPDSATTIGNGAFCDCDSLTSVTIPDSVTTIGDSAFYGCVSLTSVTIPDSVTTIGDSAFSSCTSLTSVTIPNSVTHIKSWTFCNCGSLTSVTIPDSVKAIGDHVFQGCRSLTSVTVPNSVKAFGDHLFNGCSSLTSVTIPDSVTKIGTCAFRDCDSLTSITIPDSVTTIGECAIDNCNSLTSVTIGGSVTTIGNGAFNLCNSLTDIDVVKNNTVYSSIDGVLFNKNKTTLIQYPEGKTATSYTIPNAVTMIGNFAFSGCDSLTSVTIPNSVITIYDIAFSGCTSLTRVTIPDSVTTIGERAFNGCTSLKYVHIPDTVTKIGKSILSYTTSYICSTTEDCYAKTYADANGIDFKLCTGHGEEGNYGINIPEDIVFIDKDEHYLFSAYDKNGNDITDKVNWSSTTSVDCTGEVKITNNGDVQGVKEGLTDVHVTYRPSDDLNELCFDSCYVFVGDPNELKYTSVSDSIYYYGENAFYSDVGQFSDSVDIYIALENAIHEQIEFLTENDEYADEFEKLAINGYTLTASVSGSNLSFDKDEYINNYISAFDGNIPIGKAVDELLTLYPYNLDVSSADKSFTVTIKIESEDFNTITDSFTFKISSLEDKEINEHISFINSNGMYKAMRDEDFATGMSELKDDSQYIWSKYSTLDFENYHEVLMADILVQLMETQLVGNISLLPVLKEWKSNYETILGSISTMVEDSYAGSMKITDNLLDKVIKKSKYTTDGMDVHDEVRDLVVLKLRDKVSIDKINKAFAAVDKTGQCLDLFDMGVNISNDIADWVDCVSIMNSYQNMNEEFKNVIQKVYDCIPNDDWKVKEAVNHYVKLDTTAGYTQEVIESVIELSKDITLEVFNSVFKKQFVSMFTKAVGSITLKSGALLSSTTAFSAISTGLGAISTGATLGLCISDILCNNSGQAEEIGKVVAASQLAPYVIQTLKYYEWALKNYKDESSLKHFEVAFNLNKALQIYSVEHTYKGLEIQANSIIIKLFSGRDYPGAMAELASLKTSHINCTCCEDVYTGVIKTKTIAIKCPVDVYIYDENGKEVVRIINDVAVSVEDGINVFINGREKYVTVPADQEYSVKIVATDEGTMDYLIIEHDETGQYDRIVKSLNIDLNKNQTFTGKVCEEFDVNKDSYALNTNGGVIKPDSSADVSAEISDKIPVLSVYEVDKADNILTVNIDLTENEFNSLGLIFDMKGLKCTKIEAGDSLKVFDQRYYNFNSNTNALTCATLEGVKPGTLVRVTLEIIADEYSFVVTSPACAIVVNGNIIETEPVIDGVVLGNIHKHNYATQIILPTCLKSGYTIYNCSCGEDFVADYVAASGHVPGEWIVTKPATATQSGTKTQSCIVCGIVLNTQSIPAYGKVNSVSVSNVSLDYKSSTTINPQISVDAGVKYTVSYSSSNPSVAAVDANGKVSTGKTGSATITVTVTDEYGNTVSDTCNVEVKYNWWQWIIVIVLFGWIWY